MEMRDYRTFYGINVDDFSVTFGSFISHHKLLVENYISDGCSCAETSSSTVDTNEFLYPNHIDKTYFIEGVIQGQITLAASGATTTVASYKVSIGKIHGETLTKTVLYSTGWVAVGTTLTWNETYSVGDERVYWFSIDAWEKEKLGEFERIYVHVEVDADEACLLYHSNDSTWEDLKITIPIMS
jgi:hypothetical protein